MALIASAVLFVSCAVIEEHQDEVVGYLAAPSLEIDFSVDGTLLTKAFDFEVLEPEVSEITFVVKDKDDNVKYEAKGLWAESLVLPVGSYTVEASYGTNGFDGPYFIGSAKGTIENQDQEVPALTMALTNALVRVSVDEDFGVHFSPGQEVSMKCGEVSKSVKPEEWTYIPAGEDVSIDLSLAGTNSYNDPVAFKYTLNKPSSKCAYDVLCKPDGQTSWPSIGAPIVNDSNVWACMAFITELPETQNIPDDRKGEIVFEAISTTGDQTSTAVKEGDNDVFKDLTPGVTYNVRARIGDLTSEPTVITPTLDGLTVTASHTKNSAGELDGTDVTTSFSKSQLIKDAITWDIDICKADGTILRSGLSLGNSDGSAITDVNGWPYLPTGNGESYVIKASAEMDGQTYPFDDILVAGLSVPDFSLTLSAYTSYDKYAGTNNITSNIGEANSCDPATLYNAGAKWGISANLMKNTNYAKTLIVNIDGNTDRTFNVMGDYQSNEYYEPIPNLAWQAHTLIVSVTFDKKTVSKTQTHHITGLPYTKDFTKDSSIEGWEFVGKDYDKSYSRDYKSGNGYIVYYAYTDDYGCNLFSPSFHVPQDLTINVAYQAAFNAGTTLHKDKSYTVYAGVTTGTMLVKTASTSITEKTYCSTSGYNTAQISSTSGLSDNDRLCLSHNADLSWGQGSEHYLYFGSLTVKYK